MRLETLLGSSAGQMEKGYLAGSVLLDALSGLSVNDALTGNGAIATKAWSEMHSVAHLWAAVIKVGMDDVPTFLRHAEELLDAMQSRPDLAALDPWRCSDELRGCLGLPPRTANRQAGEES